MPKLYSYKKVTDDFTTHTVQADGIVELCDLDGETIISVSDGVALPDQSKEIKLKELKPDDLLIEKIKQSSPHVQLINERVVDRIRQKIGINDELKIISKMLKFLVAKTAPDTGSLAEFDAYIVHVETCRAWGAGEKAKLGVEEK